MIKTKWVWCLVTAPPGVSGGNKSRIVPLGSWSVVQPFVCPACQQFISSASVNNSASRRHIRASQMSLCSIIIAMETTRAHVPLIIATVQESYFSSPATPLHVKCPSSGNEAVFLRHHRRETCTIVWLRHFYCLTVSGILFFFSSLINIALCLRLVGAVTEEFCASLKLPSDYNEKKFCFQRKFRIL